ncbi:hypothetical protein SRABI106_04471 [Rahnella aquatilis]|nr:hypothetical protein SRABI106_04471 [Rahnella aquatilis]
MLPEAGNAPLQQCRQNAPRTVQTRHHITNRIPHPRRFAVRPAGDLHNAAHRLNHMIVSSFMRQRSLLTKTGNTRIHQLRIDLLYGVIINAQAGGHTGPEIFHQHIRTFDQLLQHGPALR